jgi:hypothetical protein
MISATQASPFAHLARQYAEADDDDDKKKKDDAKSKKAAEDDDDDKKKDDAKSKAAEDDDDDDDKKKKDAKSKAEDDDDDDDEKKKKKDDDDDDAKARASAPADGNDASDVADDRNPVMAAARARERGRIRAIMESKFGRLHPKAAARYAFGRKSRAQAIEDLAALHDELPPVTAARDPLRDRMADAPKPDLGVDNNQQQPNLAQQIVLAGKKRRGEI